MGTKIELSSEVCSYLRELKLQYQAELAKSQKDIDAAASRGDLRENREYEIARQQYDLRRQQLSQISTVVDNCVEVPEHLNAEILRIVPMTQVTIQDIDTKESEKIYVVIDALGDVGELDETGRQISPDKVSSESPFGSMLIGRISGSVVTFRDRRYLIMSVSPINYEEFFL